jgi:hypothetical protein
MLGSYVSAAAQSTPSAEAERFFAGLLEWAGVSLPIRVTGAPLEARHLESGKDAVLFLFNHGKESGRSEVLLRRPAGDYTAVDLIQGRPVPVATSADGVSLEVELPPAGVQVIRIGRR